MRPPLRRADTVRALGIRAGCKPPLPVVRLSVRSIFQGDRQSLSLNAGLSSSRWTEIRRRRTIAVQAKEAEAGEHSWTAVSTSARTQI